jgi:hypothetical protein
MPVILGGKKIVPAPFVAINKEIRKGEDGTTKFVTWKIVLRQKLIPYKGGLWDQPDYPPDSPQFAPDNARLAGIVERIRELHDLFNESKEGQWLEIQPWNGSAPIKCQPRFLGMDYAEGKWYDYVDYTINLEADVLYINNQIFGDNLSLGVNEESWQIEPSDEKGRTFRLSHTISATAHRTYNEEGEIEREGWENAKIKVVGDSALNISSKLGFDQAFMTNVISDTLETTLDFNTWTPYNYVRSETVDEANGRFSVSENWLLFDPASGPDPQGTAPAIDSFNVDIRIGEDGRTRVTLQGTITGLETRNNTTRALIHDRYYNAQLKEVALTPSILLNRVQSYSGISVNPTPLGQSQGHNPESGVITYSREYDNRPSNFISGAITENIEIADRLPADVVAKIPVLNRPQGPILQWINSKTEKARSLDINIILSPKVYGGGDLTKPDVSPIITLYGPGGSQGFIYTYLTGIERNEENWNPLTGRYRRSISWIFE